MIQFEWNARLEADEYPSVTTTPTGDGVSVHGRTGPNLDGYCIRFRATQRHLDAARELVRQLERLVAQPKPFRLPSHVELMAAPKAVPDEV